jgi:hypothetical protein
MDGWYILVVVCASYFYNIIIFIIANRFVKKEKKSSLFKKNHIYMNNTHYNKHWNWKEKSEKILLWKFYFFYLCL